MKRRTFIILFLGILLLGIFLRFYQLDMKLMHNDEAVLYYYHVKQVIAGNGPMWSPESHGVLPNYLTAIFVDLFRLSEFSLRFAAALFGSMTIALLYFLRKEIGEIGVIVSAAFLAVSPTFVYYSRQYTGYPFYVFFLLLFIVIGAKLLKGYKDISFYGLCAAAAIIFAINELFLIFLAILAGFAFISYLFNSKDSETIFSSIKSIPKIDIAIGIMIALLVFVLIHTSFLTQPSNLHGLMSAPSELAAKAASLRHVKPMPYYFAVLFPIETGLFIMLIIGIFTIKDSISSRFAVFWSFSSLFIFSLIGYKTNWMLYAIVFPLVLAAGDSADSIIKRFPSKKIIATISIILLLSITLFFCIMENFMIYDKDVKNHLGYLETSDDTLRLVSDLKSYAYRQGECNQLNNSINDLGKEDIRIDAKASCSKGISILVTVVRAWHLNYYLQDFSLSNAETASAVDASMFPDYDVLIGFQDQFYNLSDGYYTKEYRFKFNTIDMENITVAYKRRQERP